MSKLIDFPSGATIKIDLYKSGINDREFDIYLESGNWPSDQTLMDVADGADPKQPWKGALHKGGTVSPGDTRNHKIVKVYI